MRAFLLLPVLLLLVITPVAAQAPDTARIGAALADACPGARVRLHRVEGRLVQGRCGPLLDGRLVVADGDAERVIPLEGLREVWVHERQTRDGALIGAGVGAGTLILASALFAGMLCESSDCTNDYIIAIRFGALAGGASGALIGAAAGYLTRDWERRYP